MRSSKIKNIVLFLLVMVNLSLLALVGTRMWQSEQNERETRAQMRTILMRNGIDYLPEEIPGEMPLTGQKLTLTSLNETQAALLVGTVTSALPAEGAVTYEGELGSVTFFSDGSLDARFLPGTWTLDNTTLAEVGGTLLSGFGLSWREKDVEENSVVYTQLWGDAPVPQITLTLTAEDGALERMTGRILTGTASPSEGEYLSAPTALARFLEDLQTQVYVCSQITALYPGYTVSGTTDTVTLTPTWYLETDAAWRCAVNGVTGTVTVEEPVSSLPFAP